METFTIDYLEKKITIVNIGESNPWRNLFSVKDGTEDGDAMLDISEGYDTKEDDYDYCIIKSYMSNGTECDGLFNCVSQSIRARRHLEELPIVYDENRKIV